MFANLSEPQVILLGTAAALIAGALITCFVLAATEVRCCRFCHRIDVVRGATTDWIEPTACSYCAAMKAALLERRHMRHRIPEVQDGHR